MTEDAIKVLRCIMSCEYPYVRCVEIIKKAMGHEEKTMDEGNK